MSSQQRTVDYLVEQMAGAGAISARKMFGEYGIYCGAKIVALVCGDQLFLKATKAGRAFLSEVVEAPAYPGAKPSLLISTEQWDDSEWMAQLVKATAAELPAPAPKRPAKTRPRAAPAKRRKI